MRKQLIALLSACVVFSAQADDGKRLHDSACLHCHASLTKGKPLQLYLNADRKVKSVSSLKKRVDYCAVAADVNWNAAQKEAVVNYLNNQFYHF